MRERKRKAQGYINAPFGCALAPCACRSAPPFGRSARAPQRARPPLRSRPLARLYVRPTARGAEGGRARPPPARAHPATAPPSLRATARARFANCAGGAVPPRGSVAHAWGALRSPPCPIGHPLRPCAPSGRARRRVLRVYGRGCWCPFSAFAGRSPSPLRAVALRCFSRVRTLRAPSLRFSKPPPEKSHTFAPQRCELY